MSAFQGRRPASARQRKLRQCCRNIAMLLRLSLMPGSPQSLRRVRRIFAALVAVAAAAALMVAVALGQEEEQISDLRGQREQLARDAADVARQIDALAADDQALVAALEDLEGYIELQQTRIDAAEASIAAAEAEAAAARAEAEWLVQDIAAIREKLRQRAIEAFVQPPADAVEQLSTPDPNEGAVRLFLLDLAIGNELEITDDLRTAEAHLEVVRRRAVQSAEEADRDRKAQQERLADLEDAQAAAIEMRTEIKARTEAWNLEAAQIQDADREMQREIRRIEEEIRRREAERRRQEELARRRAIEEERRAHEAANGPFQLVAWPADGEVTSGFGPRRHPIFGVVRPHNGIDLDGDTGDPVRAARSGEVILAGTRNGFGKTIVIYHGLGYSTLYGHLNSIAVSEGATVSSGDQIGTVGSTGWSTGPHLHFELRIDGGAVDPTPYLP